MSEREKINVTKTFLPPKEEYDKLIGELWESSWITNHGKHVNELERKLKDRLGVKHLFFVSNGTIALQIAIKALELEGEIITTPFSYVATSSTIVWEGIKPVYADIDENTFNIDPQKIEEKITEKTNAIVCTHVFGNPCDVEAIVAIAERHKLKVIFDAAHAFDVEYNNTSVLNYGDISTLSFHATKIFHTAEGGAVVTNNDELAHKISYLRNFGHNGQEKFFGLGINGKNSEFHAAMGLCNLKYASEIIKDRERIYNLYKEYLNHPGIRFQSLNAASTYNYAYFPIVFETSEMLMNVLQGLREENIFPRRYFYPSLNQLPYTSGVPMKNSEFIANKVMCLPSYYQLEEESILRICEIVNKQ